MPKTLIAENLALTSYNDIFTSTANVANNDVMKNKGIAHIDSIVEIPLAELHPPEFHPFQVNHDEAMDRLVQSIKQYGVREPGLARPRQEGGYEMLCGNRRKMACELADLLTMPVIIRDLDDDNAVICMVDSNLEQRERLLLSEKAWAYRVKMEALNHKGVKGDKLSAEIIAEQTGDSRNQIFRLIRLTELVIDLLDKVDTKQISFNPAVELSYLNQSEQMEVISVMEKYEIKPSLSQAVRLKKLKQAGELSNEMIETVLSETKRTTNPKKDVNNKYSEFFPADYSQEQIDDVIIKLLIDWQQKKLQETTDNRGISL